MAVPSLDFSDERQLVAGLRTRDEAAFTWLLDRHDASLRRVASTFVRTGASAEEVVQETWLAVIAGIDRFEERSTVKTLGVPDPHERRPHPGHAGAADGALRRPRPRP